MISLSLTHIQSEFWRNFSNTENFSELLLIHFFVSPFNHSIFHFFVLFSFFLQFLFDAIWELFRQILNCVDPEALNMAFFCHLT
jgi:hypothetical protein